MYVCGQCHIALKRVRLGVTIIEMFSRPPRPYKLWKADVLQCPRCSHKVIDSAQAPYAAHFEDGFEDMLAEAQAGECYCDFERVSDANEYLAYGGVAE
jgi:DNA-directed RNA polymerase subunit RPC12/RpoP